MSTVRSPRTELLAPAGDVDSLRAAVANGADAVYFGLPNFNARRRAANVTVDELPETVEYLHRHNVRGYVTFNTLLFGDELSEAAACLEAIARAGADAIIVQDLGLARLVHRLAPTLPIHASTQMTLTEPTAIEQVRQLGIQRVILARELSLEEIGRIRRATDMPLETFVHGALCISYSGQCQASHVLMDRSANRGLCAQPCRLPYELVVDGRPVPSEAPYLLCPKDLAAYDRVRNLVDLGIVALKIEGRLKNARYVAAAVRAYRAALDAALEGRAFRLDDELRTGIEQSFSRGFTHGFLDGADHQDLVHGESPKSRGVRVGTVVGRTGAGIVVDLAAGMAERLKPGDGLVIGDGRQAEAGELGGRIARVRPRGPASTAKGDPRAGRQAKAAAPRSGAAQTVEIAFILDGLDLQRVPVGATLWKNDDPKLEKELRKTFSRVEPWRYTALSIEVRAAPGEALRIRARDGDGHEAAAEWPGPLEAARKHPLTAALVAEQFARLGGTPLALEAVALLGPDGPAAELPVMAPRSVLNDLRRQIVEAIMRQRAAQAAHAVAEPEALPRLRSELAGRWPTPQGAATARLCVLVRTRRQLDAALAWQPPPGASRPARVYVDFRETREAREAVAQCRAAGMPAGLATRRILRPGEEAALEALIEMRPDALLVRNLGSLARCHEGARGIPLVADASLNAANELSAGVLADWGAARITPAVELDSDRLAALLEIVPPEFVEVVIHQRVPMFHTEHCVFAARLSGGHGRHDCGQPCRKAEAALRDRTGAELPLEADGGCRNTVYSPTVYSSRELVPQLAALGLRHFRVEFLRETPEQAAELLTLYARAVASAG